MCARGGGFTMVEVLVAVIVLAIGVMGAARLQLLAVRARHDAGLTAQALHLAASVAERMRAGAPAGMGANPYLALNYDAAAEGAPALPPALCYDGAQCDPAQLAAFDLFELKQMVYQHLPGGRILACHDGTVWDGASNSLTWHCDGAPGAPVVVKVGWLARALDSAAAGDGRPAPARSAPQVALPVAAGAPP